MPRIADTEIIIPQALSPEARNQLVDALYAVHHQLFEGVARESFSKHVVESNAEHTWIQVLKDETGTIVGYIALHLFERQLDGVFTAVFRAETDTLRDYRGGNAHARFALSLALRYLMKHPGRRAYYLGSLVQPSIYSILAEHCGEVWPRRDAQTPAELQAFMEELASKAGLKTVDPARPLVRQEARKARETKEEGESWRHSDETSADFFIEANPGHVDGERLVTLVPVTVDIILGVLRSLSEGETLQPALSHEVSPDPSVLRSDIVRQLRTAPLFSRVSSATLKEVAARAQLINMPAGRVVFREGDAGNELYLLARGAAHVLEGGDEHVVNKLGSGAVFGEIAMLAGERRSASVRTVTASTLVCIPREALLALMDANVRLRKDVWKTFAERRFESLVRGVDRYKQLGRHGRRSWLQQGEHRELEPEQVITVEPGTHLLVLSGTVEFAHPKPQVATQSALLLEVEHPLRVVAQEHARVVLLPLRGGAFMASRVPRTTGFHGRHFSN
jgi:hypothetical protein